MRKLWFSKKIQKKFTLFLNTKEVYSECVSIVKWAVAVLTTYPIPHDATCTCDKCIDIGTWNIGENAEGELDDSHGHSWWIKQSLVSSLSFFTFMNSLLSCGGTHRMMITIRPTSDEAWMKTVNANITMKRISFISQRPVLHVVGVAVKVSGNYGRDYFDDQTKNFISFQFTI